jgi:hypothetical protein
VITIKPYGGLGNRIRSVDSAIALAECTGKNLKVIWDANDELNCPYAELFEQSDKFELKEISTFYLPRKVNEKFSMFLHRLSINYPFKYDRVLHESDISRLKSENYDFCDHKRYNNIYIYINGSFLLPEEPYKYFKPVKSIENRVNDLSKEFDSYTVGVHIRRTDNKMAIINSPLERFIELMIGEKSRNKKVKFYLSTDSPETENLIVEKFDRDVIINHKELRRDRKEGIQDALIDLLCLSRTSKIIGSYWSSFSEVASEMGNVPLIIAGNTKR